MRYESFYPFSQPRGNDFFNFNNPVPPSSPVPNQNMFGMPPNGPISGPATNLFRQFQQGAPGGFQQGPNVQQGAPGGFQQGPGALGALQQGAGGSRTMSYLQTADKFINTAQQLTPMVRQFAPMIQNVPALLRLYRGFQAAPSAPVAATTAANVGANAASVASVTNGSSLPRIFQPPF